MFRPRSLVSNASGAFGVIAERAGGVPPAAELVMASGKETNNGHGPGIDLAFLTAFWAGRADAARHLQRWIRYVARQSGYFRSGGIDDAVQIGALHIFRKKEKLLPILTRRAGAATRLLRAVLLRRFINTLRKELGNAERVQTVEDLDTADRQPRLSREDAEEMAVRINRVGNQRYRVYLICLFWHSFPEQRDLLIRRNCDLAFRWKENKGRTLAEALGTERDPGERVVSWIARVFRSCTDQRTIDSIQKTQARALQELISVAHEAGRRADCEEKTSPEFGNSGTLSSGEAS